MIGEPKTLTEALNFTGGFVADVEGPLVGGEVTIEQKEELEVATLSDAAQPEYADPLDTE